MRRRSEDIELRHLRYFLAAVDQGSFRKAAMFVGVRESTISRGLRNLEDRLGASLFQRHSGGVRLTLAGRLFQRHAKAGLRLIGDGMQGVAAIGRSETGRLTVGISRAPMSSALVDLLRTYGDRHRDLKVTLVEVEPPDQADAIRRRDLDIVFAAGEWEWRSCDIITVWTERIFVALPENHPLAANDRLVRTQLVDAPLLSDPLADLGENGNDAVPAGLASRLPLLPLVAIGQGLALVSETTASMAFAGVTYRPLEDETVLVSAVWHPANDNPALRRLLSMIRSLREGRRSSSLP